MANTLWQTQSRDKPLFADILWNRPENRSYAGKLLVIGGNSHGVAAPGQAYSAAQDAGIGALRVLLPDTVQKTLGKMIPEAQFAASTPSGSFSRKALAEFSDNASWSDGVLLAGDFGKNSETAILLEGFIAKYQEVLGLAGDTLDYFVTDGSKLLERKNTLIVAELARVQKLAQPNFLIQHSMSLFNLAEILSKWTGEIKSSLVTLHAGQVVAASNGQVSITPISKPKNWPIELGAYATTWMLQQPSKPFEALTTAVFDYLS